MRSVAFFNNKGGVGKTTLLCNVAAYLSIYCNLRVCVVDADPQCNATQYLFDAETVEAIYENENSTTIFKIIEPLSLGEGFSKRLTTKRSKRFKVDLVPGDPRLALTEDLLAKDWQGAKAGEIRGIKTNLVFSDLLGRLLEYDYVLFDVSPSLGALNRAVMLSSQYFISPISLDIFSLKAFENIAHWITEWSHDWERGIENVKDARRMPQLAYNKPKFIGYVSQAYLAKRDNEGQRRAVLAYEQIREQIDDVIVASNLTQDLSNENYQMGTVPNLFSLIPMSQSNHVPVFELTARDGVVGAHFSRVRESKEIFKDVAHELIERTSK